MSDYKSNTKTEETSYEIDRENVCKILHGMVSLLIQHDGVEVHLTEGEESVFFEVLIPDIDMGKVIGRDGSTIHAIRKLFGSVMAQERLRTTISVIASDKEKGERYT